VASFFVATLTLLLLPWHLCCFSWPWLCSLWHWEGWHGLLFHGRAWAFVAGALERLVVVVAVALALAWFACLPWHYHSLLPFVATALFFVAATLIFVAAALFLVAMMFLFLVAVALFFVFGFGCCGVVFVAAVLSWFARHCL